MSYVLTCKTSAGAIHDMERISVSVKEIQNEKE